MPLKEGCLLLFLTLFPTIAFAGECLEYEPAKVTVSGKVTQKNYPGPPNYEKKSPAEKVWVLHLPQPLCVSGKKDSLNEEEKNITEIQLVLNPDQYQKYKNRIGKNVIAAGSLFHSHTGHHHTKVLLTVSEIK